MSDGPKPADGKRWRTLDRDLDRYSELEGATIYGSRPLAGVWVALVFLAGAALVAALVTGLTPSTVLIVVAAVFCGYMALNIGANDVANNMGPAVGARALPMAGAIALAAICETAGALLAGGEVVATIATGIISPAATSDAHGLTLAMLSALLAGGLWVNLATWVGAPVSTTHALVGAVMGAGAAAAGFWAVDWRVMGMIVASWILAPLLGGVVAALLLSFVRWKLIYRKDRIAAARLWLPVLIGLMAAAFFAYLSTTGLSHLRLVSKTEAAMGGIAIGGIAWAVAAPLIRRQSEGMENRNRSLKILFRLPLVIAAALLSFAHGANDVANAVGPLAAIVAAQGSGDAASQVVGVPLWVMVLGGTGLSLGLILFGPRLIGLVGSRITRLNPIRSFCVALSAAVTVIAASGFGLPVSSTHVALGGVFGIGFYREWQASRGTRTSDGQLKPMRAHAPEERQRRMLVRRSHFLTIAAAWIVTAPAAALLAAGAYLGLAVLFP